MNVIWSLVSRSMSFVSPMGLTLLLAAGGCESAGDPDPTGEDTAVVARNEHADEHAPPKKGGSTNATGTGTTGTTGTPSNGTSASSSLPQIVSVVPNLDPTSPNVTVRGSGFGTNPNAFISDSSGSWIQLPRLS